MTSNANKRAETIVQRRRDPKALATILIGQLMAYRCSTVYAPSTTRINNFLSEEVFPRLEEQFDIRKIIVEKWQKPGPTVEQLVDEIHRQLDIEPTTESLNPLAALERVLRRAERRSDRPILMVLYRLDELLDDDHLPVKVMKFVDALSRLAAMPIHGFQLILGVKEESLGAFRELLRGCWRLLANDIRIRPSGKKWLIPLPIGATTAVTSPAAAGAIASGGKAGIAALTGLLGLGVGAAIGATLLASDPRLERCQQELAQVEEKVCPECPEVPVFEPTSTPDLPPPEPETVATTETPETTGDIDETSTTDDEVVEDPQVTTRVNLCSPSPSDNNCATCVKKDCCKQLNACRTRRWRNCVLKKRVGEESCLPAQIEKRCRGLALCALEYQCRPSCYQN